MNSYKEEIRKSDCEFRNIMRAGIIINEIVIRLKIRERMTNLNWQSFCAERGYDHDVYSNSAVDEFLDLFKLSKDIKADSLPDVHPWVVFCKRYGHDKDFFSREAISGFYLWLCTDEKEVDQIFDMTEVDKSLGINHRVKARRFIGQIKKTIQKIFNQPNK